jgi:deoxyadenosine/deoxycytidine kinase
VDSFDLSPHAHAHAKSKKELKKRRNRRIVLIYIDGHAQRTCKREQKRAKQSDSLIYRRVYAHAIRRRAKEQTSRVGVSFDLSIDRARVRITQTDKRAKPSVRQKKKEGLIPKAAGMGSVIGG